MSYQTEPSVGQKIYCRFVVTNNLPSYPYPPEYEMYLTCSAPNVASFPDASAMDFAYSRCLLTAPMSVD